MAYTKIEAEIKIDRWTGEKFQLNLERRAEIKLPLEASGETVVTAIKMVLNALESSGVEGMKIEGMKIENVE